MTPLLTQAMAETAQRIEAAFETLLPHSDLPEGRVHEAMRYACMNGGKRLRPMLVIAASEIFSVAPESALRVAASLECVHCYSLVHDDLPAMDDSPLRRGRPTVHRKFDDATAILAGDGLLTLAFEILADPRTHADPLVRTNLITALAKAAGSHGMVGGQMLDLIGEDQPFDHATAARMQRLKTGALISYACESGAILAKVAEKFRQALSAYAHDLGLAFQIVDDLLDVEGDPDTTGKATGQDEAKTTFVSLMGVDRAREQAELLIDQAIGHLAVFDDRGALLRDIARFVLERKG